MVARLASAIGIILATSAPGIAEPFHHPLGEWREYHRDWLAVCPDNIDEDATSYYGFSCFASTTSQDVNSAGNPVYRLSLIRSRLSGETDIAITIASDRLAVDPSRPLTMNFGSGTVESFAFGADLETRYDTTNQYFVVDPDRAAALLEVFRQRNAVVVSVPMQGELRPTQVRLSLRGVLTSIDFMSTYARRVAQY